MTPLELLILAVAVTAAAVGWHYLARYQQRQALSKLARQAGMNYAPADRFKLAGRVREHFPVPGAADLKVLDVIYGLGDDCHRYLFTVQYTQGVLRTKHRRQRVAAIIEPRITQPPTAPESAQFFIAPPDENLLAEYQTLLAHALCPAAPPV